MKKNEFGIVCKEEKDGYRKGQWYATFVGELTSHPDAPNAPYKSPLGVGTYGDTRETALAHLREAALEREVFWHEASDLILNLLVSEEEGE